MSSDDQSLTPISDTDIIDQRMVPFEGDELAAAQSTAGDIYITIAGMCKALGLNTQSQTRRIQRTPALAKGLRRISLKTKGGTQPTICLRLDRVALWIAGIETDRIRPEYQTKIEAYQDELAPIATHIFMQAMGITTRTSTDSRMTALADQYDVLIATTTFIAEHMESLASMPEQIQGISNQLAQAVSLLESLATQQTATATTMEHLTQEQRLTAAQKKHIKEAVQIIVDDSADKPHTMTYAQIYGIMFRQFRVTAYAEIPAARYDEVITFLRNLWKQATSGTLPEQTSLF
jgi:hypothetical protein